jgi:hypothetical protein
MYNSYGQGKFVYSRNGSVNRQKLTINQNCTSYAGQNSVYGDQKYLFDEPKPVSEKDFEKYILLNYQPDFPKTSIVFHVIFQRNQSPCCRQINISDSLAMDTKQLDILADLVSNYPKFANVQFDTDEDVKYLVIHMGRYKKNPLSVGFGYK